MAEDGKIPIKKPTEEGKDYKLKRYPDSFSTRGRNLMIGHPTIMNMSREYKEMTIYQLTFVHIERKGYQASGDDNVNVFTVVAENEDEVLSLFDAWYYSWSQSAIPYDSYDIVISPVIRNIQSKQKGVIQFAYRW